MKKKIDTRLTLKFESVPDDLALLMENAEFILWTRETRLKFGIPDTGFPDLKEYFVWIVEPDINSRNIALVDYSEKEFYLSSKNKLLPVKDKVDLHGKQVNLTGHKIDDLRADVHKRFPTYSGLWISAISNVVLFGSLPNEELPDKRNIIRIVKKCVHGETKYIIRIEVDANTNQKEYRELYSEVSRYQKILSTNQKGKLRKKKNFIRDKTIYSLVNRTKKRKQTVERAYIDSVDVLQDKEIELSTFTKSKQRVTNKLARLLLDTKKD